jgi:hypothetical protein
MAMSPFNSLRVVASAVLRAVGMWLASALISASPECPPVDGKISRKKRAPLNASSACAHVIPHSSFRLITENWPLVELFRGLGVGLDAFVVATMDCVRKPRATSARLNKTSARVHEERIDDSPRGTDHHAGDLVARSATRMPLDSPDLSNCRLFRGGLGDLKNKNFGRNVTISGARYALESPCASDQDELGPSSRRVYLSSLFAR